MADITPLGKGTTCRDCERGVGFLMTTAALHQFLTMGMFVASGTFGQNFFVVRLTSLVRVKLQVALSALHTAVHGVSGSEESGNVGMTLHALLSG